MLRFNSVKALRAACHDGHTFFRQFWQQKKPIFFIQNSIIDSSQRKKYVFIGIGSKNQLLSKYFALDRPSPRIKVPFFDRNRPFTLLIAFIWLLKNSTKNFVSQIGGSLILFQFKQLEKKNQIT